MTGCAHKSNNLRYKRIIPKSLDSLQLVQKFNGTASIHSRIIWRGNYGLAGYITDNMLQEALEETITNCNLFTNVLKEKEDYVLDIWVEKSSNHAPTMGIGEYTADVSSIWRLARVSDGKILICDNVDGKSVARGMNPLENSLDYAMRDMIQNGIKMLSDSSTEHLAAKSVAGMRQSMGSVTVEGYAQWAEKVKQNWAKLKIGLTMDEVEAAIGPVKTSGAIISSFEDDYRAIKAVGSETSTTINLSYKYWQEYETDIYVIEFLNGMLARFQLK